MLQCCKVLESGTVVPFRRGGGVYIQLAREFDRALSVGRARAAGDEDSHAPAPY
jgi:hypothetical protein